MADVLYNCDDEIIAPVCDPCLDEIELGRVRSIAFIHKDIFAAVAANPTDANTWAQGIQDKKLFVIPETQGAFDGGSPNEVAGYGHVSTRVVGYEFVLSYKDPAYKANCGFYNSIKGSTKWHVAYATDTLTRISGKPVSIAPKSPIGDDDKSEVVWEVDVKWTEKDHPCPFETPDGIFTCTPIEPVPVEPFTFYFGFGEVPEDDTEVELGTSGTANHNGKATVADFGNVNDEVLWYAEPVSEPAKSKWYNTPTNQGSIGGANLFGAPVTVGNYRVYSTAYATTFSSPAAVEFRVN